MKNVAVIGAGLQAERRIPAILDDPVSRLAVIVDIVHERAQKLAQRCGASYATDWREVVSRPDIDIVLVLTYPDSHADIAIAAMKAGKDVLCEKPLARTASEANVMVTTAQETKRIVKCGFNHRHHPAVKEAHRLFAEGAIGQPVFGRGRYGIAGREGIENEWRSDPHVVGGGQLMDQGIHLVDLFRWFIGEITTVTGMTSTRHWPIAPLEDNGFALLKTSDGTIVSIHSSLTQWINLFHFELYGTKGSIAVEGLGGGYGVEKLVVSHHDPNGPFSETVTEYRAGDRSWQAEWQEFLRAVETRTQPLGNGVDGLRAMEIVNAAYEAAHTGHAVHLTP